MSTDNGRTSGDASETRGVETAVRGADAPPAVELVGRTRQDEARLAVASVRNLLEHGVSPSDVVITTADPDRYEAELDRAAARYGVTTATWTPLPLKRHVPYRLVESLLAVLAARARGRVGPDTLAAPLRLGWVPGRGERGPLTSGAVTDVVRGHTGAVHTLDEWKRIIVEAAVDRDVKKYWMAYCNWVSAQPQAPASTDIAATLKPVLTRYDDVVLPERPGDASVSELAARLRAFDRTMELVGTTRKRYARLLASDRVSKQWETVQELFDAFGSTVPGRRELPTAAAVDVMAANDLWGVSVPYVVAVGLVDAEWPETPESPVPSAARALINDGNVAGIRPHQAWTTARGHDQFASAVTAATAALVVTRHRTDADGVDKRPSRFLDALEATQLDAPHALVETPTALPGPLAAHLPVEVSDD